MSPGLLSRRRRRVRSGAAIWWDALSSGRFFTGWSALVAVPLGVVVLAPYVSANTPGEVLAAQTAALIVMAGLVAAILPAARGERCLSSPTARGVVVLLFLIAASAARPFLNEAVAVGVFGLAPDVAWFERIVTNIVAWVSVLSLVAVTEQLYASSRTAKMRLLEALRTVSDEQRRAGRYERESRAFLTTEIATLREALSALMLARLDFDRVRVFSDAVRSVSHRAFARAGLTLGDVAPDREDPPPVVARRGFLERLRPSAVGLVGTIFALGSAPYAVRTGGAPLLLVIVPGLFLLCLLADGLVRRLARRFPARARGQVLLGVWTLTGIVVSAAGVAILDLPGLVPLTPAIALPGIAVIAALSADAVHRGRVEARRLGRALRDVVRSAAERTTATRRSLEHASDILHGRVQGTCVVLAARVDDDLATLDDIEAFERAVDGAFSDALAVAPRSGGEPAGLDATMAIWQPVMSVSSRVDESAAAAMADPLVSVQVVAIVAEGLVNAVKHATERAARVEVSGSERPGALRVSVSSPGVLRIDPAHGGLGVSGLGPSARVFQHGPDVVLEVSVPVGAGDLVGAGQAGGALHESDSM
ncbi:MAG: hypothetical protein PGN24_12155 [Microbacterium arborescens]